MDVLGQFKEIGVTDTEFRRSPGGLPEPVCCVCAKELKTGREVRVWTEHGAPQPFSTGSENLFVAHYSSAEWVSFLSLGWVPPINVIDTYVEGRVLTNGMPGRKDAVDKSEGRRRRCGLTHLAAMYGISAISDAMKDAGRELAMKGAPWSEDEQSALMTYCMTDVETCSEVFMAMLPEITAPVHGLAQVLIRGRYMRACAQMELWGIPVDVDLVRRFKANWRSMRQQLIELVDPGRYDCFVDGKFSKQMLQQLIDRLGITDWPRTPSAQLSTERTLFRDMAARYPELEELKELYSTLQSMKEFNLGVGPDGRHRAEMLSPFGTNTMRHNPSKFILALARWFRGLVKPAPGRAVVYSDYGAQEIFIAAWLSQDPNLLEAVHSGDPYLWFAIKVGLAPEGASKATHKALRDWLKPFLLGIHYGLSVIGAAVRLGVSIDEAGRLLDKHRRLFPAYWQWSENKVHLACEMGVIRSRWGWRMYIRGDTTLRSLQNHPIQTAGAHILQFAIIGMTEIGISVCCPLHDAVVTECHVEDVDQHLVTVGAVMEQASEIALGMKIPVNHEVVTFPSRYMDKRPGSQEMFDKAMEALAYAENECVGTNNGNRIGMVGRSGSGGMGGTYNKGNKEQMFLDHPYLPPPTTLTAVVHPGWSDAPTGPAHGRSALRPIAVETKPNVRSEPDSGRADTQL